MSLAGAWTARWAEDPGHLCVEAPIEQVAWSADELQQRSAGVAQALSDRGVGAGDRVLVSCAPSSALVATYVALVRMGACVVPANTAYTAHELRHIARVTKPVLAVMDDVGRAQEICPAITPEQLLQAPRAGSTVSLDVVPSDAEMLIGFTSGTTGKPKGAVHLQRTMLAGAQSVVDAWEWTADDRLLLTLPLFHMHGIGVGLNGALLCGSTIRLLPRFDPAAIAAEAPRATMFFGVPTMYARLLESGHASALHAMRLIVSGSAPLDPVLFAAVTREARQAPLERYGMTETVMISGNPLRGERRAGSVGLPLPGVSLRLEEDTCQVLVCSPAVFARYDGDPDSSASAWTDGWFRTGDIGEFDSDGYLRLVGRASELIITGGYNVYPREVEDALVEHAGVQEACVVGIPDTTWGEVVVAAIVGEASEDLLREHLLSHVADYKLPRRWVHVAELPRNAMGKVQRGDVRTLFDA